MLYKSRCCRGYSCEAFFISWWLEKAGAQSNHGQHCNTRLKPPSAVAHQGGFLQQEPSQSFWVAGLLPECHCCLGVSLEGVSWCLQVSFLVLLWEGRRLCRGWWLSGPCLQLLLVLWDAVWDGGIWSGPPAAPRRVTSHRMHPLQGALWSRWAQCSFLL